MEDTIAKMVDLENEISLNIDALVDLKAEIMRRIKARGEHGYQTILELRYLCFKRWESAVEMNFSLQHLYRLHEKAVNCVKIPQ